jgi:hypothetical protein
LPRENRRGKIAAGKSPRENRRGKIMERSKVDFYSLAALVVF